MIKCIFLGELQVLKCLKYHKKNNKNQKKGYDDEGHWVHFNDMHVFDLKTDTWTEIIYKNSNIPKPVEASNALRYKNCKIIINFFILFILVRYLYIWRT